MAIRKIKRVGEPRKDNRTYRGGTYIIWYKGPDEIEYSRYVHELEYNRLVFEQKMLNKGISEADIEEYEKLLRAEIQEETDFNGCISCD